MQESKLYRCCNTCTYKDDSFYGCSKSGVCYNGFSAYSPNVAMKKQEEQERVEIIKHLDIKMPFCDKGRCLNNWELNCITENEKIIENRTPQGADSFIIVCPCFEVGEHDFYKSQ